MATTNSMRLALQSPNPIGNSLALFSSRAEKKVQVTPSPGNYSASVQIVLVKVKPLYNTGWPHSLNRRGPARSER